MSQLDLGLAADISARHISFLETGRSRPSVEMVELLGEVLDVPLRSRNELLRAAGFRPNYPEPTTEELLAGPLGDAVDALLHHGDPYPVMVIDRGYRLARTNRGGRMLLALAGVDAEVADDWRLPDLSGPSDPMISMDVRAGDVRLRFLTTVTVFSAPNNVTLEELQIENHLPVDDATRAFFTGS